MNSSTVALLIGNWASLNPAPIPHHCTPTRYPLSKQAGDATLATVRRGIAIFLFALGVISAASAAHLGKSLKEWQLQLEASSRVERLIAARSIGEMAIAGDRSAAKTVVKNLDHSDAAIRYWGAIALGEMRGVSRSARARLRQALADDASDVQVASALALIRLGETEGSVETLIRVLEGSEETARLHAAHALDDIGEAARPAVAVLRKAVSDDFGYVQRVARHALYELGERPCPYQSCE